MLQWELQRAIHLDKVAQEIRKFESFFSICWWNVLKAINFRQKTMLRASFTKILTFRRLQASMGNKKQISISSFFKPKNAPNNVPAPVTPKSETKIKVSSPITPKVEKVSKALKSTEMWFYNSVPMHNKITGVVKCRFLLQMIHLLRHF